MRIQFEDVTTKVSAAKIRDLICLPFKTPGSTWVSRSKRIHLLAAGLFAAGLAPPLKYLVPKCSQDIPFDHSHDLKCISLGKSRG